MYKEERTSVVLQNCGHKLFAILHMPIIKEKVPAVMICHGFGGNKIGSNRLFVLLAEALSSSGIATLRLDLRGAGDSEGDFKETTIFGLLSDIVTGLHFLGSHEKVHPNRIGTLGVSLGGMLSIMAAKQFNTIASLALWAPVASSFQWEDEKSREVLSQHDYIEYNGKLVTKRFYEEFFMIDIEPELQALGRTPLLHIHGQKDSIVSQEHQEKYKSWRKEASAANKFITLSEIDHSFSDRKEQQMMLQETTKWFKETL
ncbi:MAG: alpha/beta hydrolase [Chlamydiales bacterium]|nr:alpha/beta hydrolase [Chlamydiales bacterium]